jgi:hypothetical protein
MQLLKLNIQTSTSNQKYLKKLIYHNITHDMKLPVEKKANYYNITYSNHRHSCQMDIFVNQYKHISDYKIRQSNFLLSSSVFSFYYLILININTRYVIISHMNNKSSSSVLSSFKSSLNQLEQNIK